jgi:DNA-binding CsgD family transcriptional regulator
MDEYKWGADRKISLDVEELEKEIEQQPELTAVTGEPEKEPEPESEKKDEPSDFGKIIKGINPLNLELNAASLLSLARAGLTDKQIASILQVDQETISKLGPRLEAARTQLKLAIVKRQMEIADGGQVEMLKWLGKQYCGQSEKQ